MGAARQAESDTSLRTIGYLGFANWNDIDRRYMRRRKLSSICMILHDLEYRIAINCYRLIGKRNDRRILGISELTGGIELSSHQILNFNFGIRRIPVRLLGYVAAYPARYDPHRI